MAKMLQLHHFDCWCGAVFHAVRGKQQARLATTDVLGIKIGVTVQDRQQKGVVVYYDTNSDAFYRRLMVKNDIIVHFCEVAQKKEVFEFRPLVTPTFLHNCISTTTQSSTWYIFLYLV
jgi:hypothetical protein